MSEQKGRTIKNSNFSANSFIHVNNCGYYENQKLPPKTERPKGRIDYHLILIDKGTTYVSLNREMLKLSNDRYSWGISRILNQNSVNSEFVKWRPRVSLSPFFAFFMWDYFPLQGDITLFANITPKNNFTFS